MTEPILAIDFGTSNSLVGAFQDGKRIEALALDPSAEDQTLMRTLLYFSEPDICFYGQEAKSEYIKNEMEGRLFRSFKAHLPNQSYTGTMIGNRIVTLENMIGYFLLELKKRSEKILGRPIDSAVFGKPARYSMDPVKEGFALHRMKKAIEFAGFKHFEFVPEPLAAAFDYRRNLREEKIVLIGDFGGGTSDFTIIRVGPYAFNRDHVLAIDGCPLAGDALDSLFMKNRLSHHFGAQTKYRLPMSSNILTMPPGTMQNLNQPAHIVHLKQKETYEFIKEVRKCALMEKDKAKIDNLFVLIEENLIFSIFETIERTKRNLSESDEVDFDFESPGLHIKDSFSKKDFTDWAIDAKEKIFQSLENSLTQANLKPEQIDLVCLTGGTAKVPLIREELEKRFGRNKLQTQSHFHSVLSGLIESAELWQNGTLN